MTQDIAIIGIGGFGREVADLIKAINAASPSTPPWNLLGFLDDAPSEKNIARAERQGNPYLGPVEPEGIAGRPHFVVAINNGSVRKKIVERVEEHGWVPSTLIHPSTRLGSDCTIGAGSILCGGTSISTNVTLGRHVHVNPNVNIGHDTYLQDFVSVNPLAAVSGDVVVGEGSLIGAGSFVLQGLSLAAWTVVGASACVVKSTASPATLVGVPAKRRESLKVIGNSEGRESQWKGVVNHEGAFDRRCWIHRIQLRAIRIGPRFRPFSGGV